MSALDTALAGLHMVATPCVDRQSRAERAAAARLKLKTARKQPVGRAAAPSAAPPPAAWACAISAGRPACSSGAAPTLCVNADAARRMVSHALGSRPLGATPARVSRAPHTRPGAGRGAAGGRGAHVLARRAGPPAMSTGRGGTWDDGDDEWWGPTDQLSGSEEEEDEGGARGGVELGCFLPPATAAGADPAGDAGWAAALEARLEAQRATWGRRVAGEADDGVDRPRGGGLPHVSCEELWGDLDADQALALAIALSEEAEGQGRGDSGGAAWPPGASEEGETRQHDEGACGPKRDSHAAWNSGYSEEEALALALELSGDGGASGAAHRPRAGAAEPSPPWPAGRGRGRRITPTRASPEADTSGGGGAGTLRPWAASRLRELLGEGTSETPEIDALLELSLSIDDDAEMIEYIVGFVGEHAAPFALDLAAARR